MYVFDIFILMYIMYCSLNVYKHLSLRGNTRIFCKQVNTLTCAKYILKVIKKYIEAKTIVKQSFQNRISIASVCCVVVVDE